MKKLYRYPWLIIAIIALITLFFGFQLPNAELDNNNLRFVPPDDEALETSRWIDDMFGSSFFILVGLERRYGTVFDREFLERIREYSEAIEDIPIVKEITSLITADFITFREDAIVVEKLVGSDFSGTQEEIAELRRRLLSWDMYDRALFSDDFTSTQILVPLTIDADEAGLPVITDYIMQIRDAARETFSGHATVYVTGMPVIAATVTEAMHADLKLLVPLVILVVLAVLFFSFRGFTPVVLPLLTVLISVIWAVGSMALFGVKLSVVSTVLPVILAAVGSAYGIHVMTHYLAGCSMKNNMNAEEHRELVLETVLKIRKPVFLAALTTFAGFASFCFTSVAPCREFGYFSGFGVAAAFIVAITLVPALLIIRGPRRMTLRETTPAENAGFSGFIAVNLASIAQRKKTIFFFAVVVVAFSLYGLSKLIIDNVMVEYFRQDTDIYRSDDFIRRQFGGSKAISVVAHADSPEVTLRPDTLAAMDGLSAFLQRTVPHTGKVMGFTDLVKRINQVFNADASPDGLPVNENFIFCDEDGVCIIDFYDDFGAGDFPFGFGFGFDEELSYGDTGGTESTEDTEGYFTQHDLIALLDKAGNHFRGMNANDLIWELKQQINYEGASYYEIPLDPKRYGLRTPADLQRLVSNYLVLLSGNIGAYANDPLEPTAIKALVQLRTMGMEDSNAIFDEIEQYVAANFPSDVSVTLGGTTMVERSLNNLVVQSQIISMVLSIICVFIIIAVSNKSLVAGCIGIIPLSISILLNFAIMGFAGIKLNLGTSMVAAVSIGVGIDYTIHCIEAYKREYRATGGTGDFLRRVFFSSGKAIIINAVSVGAGFAVLLFSSFVMLADFGLLIAVTMFSSALVSLTVLPALLGLLKPRFVL
ncbi:MAG: efflux RND transporter permease subunit [Treponema sp.]|nr:efflux RND transporter permease subunit [Treponema sp.]